MAAYAALASLLNTIDPITKHPRLSTSFPNTQIQTLVETAASLLDFIEGYNYGGGASTEEIKELEREIASAAHEAEDAIESQIVHQIRTGSNRANRGFKRSLQRIIQAMDDGLKGANELKERGGLREERSVDSTPAMEIGEAAATVVGFEDELYQLMDELTDQRSGRHVISIVGMGGMGKTTLAQNVYRNLHMKRHFDFRAWATVSQQYNSDEILSQLLSGLRTVGELGEQLHKALYGRRYLVVLDDVWSVEAWDKVRRFFPDNGNGSRVVLTTRLSSVVRECCSSSCLMMKPQDEHTSWKLFCKKTFEQENCPYPELEGVGREISRLCRGLPLSTVVIGGLLLKSPKSVEFWENVVRNIKSGPRSKEKEESLDILALSYSHLPPHLKPCFLFMGVFEEDSEIRVSKIIELWVAEGLIRPNNTRDLEEIAEDYLKELIDRNLIVVRKYRSNKKVGCCGIHDLLRDLCLKVGEEEEFLPITELKIQGIRGIQGTEQCLNLDYGAKKIHSELAYPTRHVLMMIWDEGHDASREELYGNGNLRYLAHFYPSFDPKSEWKLPSSVSLIWNLQTLILRNIYSDEMIAVAPIEIWTMRHLRHVKCPDIYLPPPPPGDGLLIMNSLQTLTAAVNLRLSKQVCTIIPNIKKLHVSYGRLWDWDKDDVDDDSLTEFVRNLGCLHKLESLSLRLWNPDPELSKILAFPVSLNKLSLRGSLLGWEDLWKVASLPRLEVLHLQIYSESEKTEHQWITLVNYQFPHLKVLKLVSCDLEYWDADKSSFPVLEKLHLIDLSELMEIPICFSEIPSLELVRVDRCSEAAAVSAVKIKEVQMENQGSDDLQIQLRMFGSKLKSFKEKVNTVDDNIQLEIC